MREIKYDGYPMHARLGGKQIKLLTRTGLDWSHRYRRTIEAIGKLRVKSAYVDGELCALNSDGIPVFSRLQVAMAEGKADELILPTKGGAIAENVLAVAQSGNRPREQALQPLLTFGQGKSNRALAVQAQQVEGEIAIKAWRLTAASKSILNIDPQKAS